MQRYQGKVVLVTGGGSGLGEAFSHRFAAEGARVGVLDIDAAGGGRVADAITAAGGSAAFIPCDITDYGAVESSVAAVVKAYGTLDVAVNNAGIGGGMYPLPDFPLDAWNRTIQVNLTGTFHCMRAEIPAMMDRGGSIINIASITAIVAHAMTAPYIASKHAILGLTKSAALEWGHRQIRVNAVGPTYVRTPLTQNAFSEESWNRFEKQHALGRCATTEDIAAVVSFLGSDEAKFVTGSLYLADGGYTAA